MNDDDPVMQFQEQITELVDKLDPPLEALRSQGVNALLLTHYYDPMTAQSYVQWREVGDQTAMLGMVEEYRWARQSRINFVHGGDDGDD